VACYADVWRVEVRLQSFLSSAFDGGECSASSPGRLTLGERNPSTPWMWGWVSRTGCLGNETYPGRKSCFAQNYSIQHTDWAIPDFNYSYFDGHSSSFFTNIF